MAGEVILDDLAEKLRAIKARGLATQAQIAAATGVDQPTISRILNGQRRRVTPHVVRLAEYVNMRLKGGKLSPKVQKAARSFLVKGGTEAELIASIEHSTALVVRELRQTPGKQKKNS